MDIPNFIGLEYTKAIEYIKQNIPQLEVLKTIYLSKKVKNDSNLDEVTSERIIRQNILSEDKIEFVVSVFNKHPLQ